MEINFGGEDNTAYVTNVTHGEDTANMSNTQALKHNNDRESLAQLEGNSELLVPNLESMKHGIKEPEVIRSGSDKGSLEEFNAESNSGFPGIKESSVKPATFQCRVISMAEPFPILRVLQNARSAQASYVHSIPPKPPDRGSLAHQHTGWIASMADSISLPFSVEIMPTVWTIWTHRNRVRTNHRCCSPNKLVNWAKELLTKFQAVQQTSLPQSTPIGVRWRGPILDMGTGAAQTDQGSGEPPLKEGPIKVQSRDINEVQVMPNSLHGSRSELLPNTTGQWTEGESKSLFSEGVAVILGNPIQWVNAINEPQRKTDPGPLNSAPPSMPSPICVHSEVSQPTRAYSTWMVWNQRNKTQLNLQATSFHQVAEQEKEILAKYRANLQVPTAVPNVQVINSGSGGTRWRCPQVELVKINFDGAVFSASNMSGFGMVIRDSNGAVLATCSQKIPQAYKAKVIEALVALKALSFAFELGFCSAIRESDSRGLIQALKSEKRSLSPTGLLIEDVKMFSNNFVKLLYSHVKRNGNKVAHNLAKNVLCIPDFQVWMEDVPSHIVSILQLVVVELH